MTRSKGANTSRTVRLQGLGCVLVKQSAYNRHLLRPVPLFSTEISLPQPAPTPVRIVRGRLFVRNFVNKRATPFQDREFRTARIKIQQNTPSSYIQDSRLALGSALRMRIGRATFAFIERARLENDPCTYTQDGALESPLTFRCSSLAVRISLAYTDQPRHICVY